MKALYLDNFRNFYEELITLEEVNFFVGENSTGKSSVLALINLLGSFDFWISINPMFNTREYEFGYYDEIADSLKNRGIFTIGILLETTNEALNCIEMKFDKSPGGLPRIRKYRYIENGYEFILEFGMRQNKILHRKIEVPPTIDCHWFHKWVQQNDSNNYSEVELPASMLTRQFPFVFWHDRISRAVFDEKYNNKPHTEEVIFSEDFCWMAPIRTKPQRVYSLEKAFTPEGDHSPYTLKKLIKQEPRKQLLVEYGKNSNLFNDIKIKSLGAEVGSPFEINLVLGNKTIKLSNSGYGVSQILPIATELLRSNSADHYLLQQPEVHLHPRAQAEFGGLLHAIYSGGRKKFSIETHSDFLIDRFRLSQKNNPCKNFRAQVVYFQRNQARNKICNIKINKDGSYARRMPRAFRQFFINESLQMLEV